MGCISPLRKTLLNVIDGLTDELTRATIDENWKFRVGRQTDLRIKFNAPDLTVRQEGYFQIINLEGHEITIGSNATDDQIAAEIARIRNEIPKMPTIAEQLRAARAEIANARQGAVDAVAQTGEAVNAVKAEIKKLEKEAADFRAEVAELTNGGPEL
jgi:septal ring factor EnvC (AmiA/AmiB activator)